MVPARRRLFYAAWASLCLGPRVLPAQDAPYRPLLNQLRASLDSAQSVTEVGRIAAAWDSTATKPVGRLGNAFIDLRRGTLMNDRHMLVAAWGGFDQVVRTHPDWPYARLGLAVAALEIYSRRYSLPASYDDVAGGTHYDGYAIQMKRTLRAEPAFQPAIDWLAAIMSAEGDRQQPDGILRLLRFVADSTGSTDPRIQLILARAERLEGQPEQSLPRLEAYRREGGDSGIAALEVARTLAWMSRVQEAALQYLAGARAGTAEARAAYRLDVSWVATPRELARFDSLPTDSVGEYVSHFWSKRDVQELRPDGSRLQEHLRRWAYVSQRFRVPDPGRRTAWREVFIPYSGTPCQSKGANSLDDYDYIEPSRVGGYRAPERVFDHRAVVYMRHGEPFYRLGGDTTTYTNARRRDVRALPGAPASDGLSGAPALLTETDRNVTWAYLIGGQLRTYTFLGHQALGSNSASTLIVNAPPNLAVVQQLASLSDAYSRLAGAAQFEAAGGSVIPLTCQRSYLDVVDQQREDAGVAVATDTYLRRFSQPLAASIQLAAMGQPSAGTGDLFAVFGVRMTDLASEPSPPADTVIRFVLRLQIAAIDSLSGESVRMDTVRHFVSSRQAVERHAWLTFIARLPLRPGLREVRLSVEQADNRGSVFSAVIDPAGPGFSASDIVLGSEHGSMPWRRHDETVHVSPFSTFAVDESVPLYYELYGFGGGEYRTRISLRRAGDTKFASTLTSTDRVAEPTGSFNKALTLTGVKPGKYDLILTVDDPATGGRVVRQRSITVIDR